jgi:hypothetical protein
MPAAADMPAPQPAPDRLFPKLVTESDVKLARADGLRLLRYGKGAVITPLARDLAWEAGIELRPGY